MIPCSWGHRCQGTGWKTCVQSSLSLSKVVHHFEGETNIKCVQILSWTTDRAVAGHMRPVGCSSLWLGNLRINQSKHDRIINFSILKFQVPCCNLSILTDLWGLRYIHLFIKIRCQNDTGELWFLYYAQRIRSPSTLLQGKPICMLHTICISSLEMCFGRDLHIGHDYFSSSILHQAFLI